MTVDDVLADPGQDLPAGAIPLHAIVLIEYANPGSDSVPGQTRLAVTVDDTLTAWTAIGMLRFALQQELDDVAGLDPDPDP